MRRLIALHETNLLWAIVGVWVLTAVLDSQHNYWVNPATSAVDLTRQTTLLGFLALGAAVVIISGGIDLSAGSVMAFSSTTCAVLLLLLVPDQMVASQPLPLWAIVLSVCGTLVVGFLIGSLHAWLITVVGLPPFVATLGTLVGLRSLGRAICEGATAATLGGMSTQINIADARFRYVAGSVWIPAVLLLVTAAVLWVLLAKTVTGRHMYALGGNEQAAKLSGIRTDGLKWLAYSLSAVLSSIAGMLAMLDTGVANPQVLGRGAELNAIAAAVVGGCSLQGGVGTVPGTLLGAIFLRSVIDSVAKIIKTGADVYEGLIVGVLVVGAVTFARAGGGGSRKLLGGPLGAVAVLNLTILTMALTALIGTKLLGGRTSVDALPLSLWTGSLVAGLMLFMRTDWWARRRGIFWLAWVVVAGVSFVALDRAYPAWQQNRAVGLIQSAGGTIARNETGILVDLSETSFADADLKSLISTLRFFPVVAELNLSQTQITDTSVADLEKLGRGLRQVRLSFPVTRGAATRLERRMSGVRVEYVDR
jgi:ribose/xylose/arabinose/galactoside ABC-type transport system permease subunit